MIFDRVDETNRVLAGKGTPVIRKVFERTILDLDGGYDAVIRNLAKSTRDTITKSSKRLQKSGTLVLHAITDFTGLMEAYGRMIELESEGWKGNTVFALKRNTFSRAMYESIIEGFSPLGMIFIFELRYNEQLIACALSVVHEQTVYSIKIIYNEQFAKYSPGNVLYERLFHDYIDYLGLKKINLVSDSPHFRKTWRAQKMDAYKCFFFRGTALGAGLRTLYPLCEIIKPRWKRGLR